MEWIVVLPVLRDGGVTLRLHLRAFTQGQGSISDCQEKLLFLGVWRAKRDKTFYDVVDCCKFFVIQDKFANRSVVLVNRNLQQQNFANRPLVLVS